MADDASIWEVSEAYERYIGRWSRPVADEFVGWLALPGGLRWLDVGCGTGALARAIAAAADPLLVQGVDRSSGFVERARRLAGSTGPQRFSEGDALDLPVADSSFDVAVSGLVLNFLEPPAQAVSELRRAVCTGGTVAVYVWDYTSGMQLLRRFWDGAGALDPEAVPLDEGRRFPICEPAALAALFGDAGLAELETRSIVVPTVFDDFDDLWNPFLGGQGPAPAYAMSLSERDRVALREHLRASLPVGSDGSIALTARAFAVRGRG
jgi:SAM-dependent methyltransferase